MTTEANETTTTPAKAKRRAILAAAPALALGAAPGAAASPDAALIRMVDDFIARQVAADAASAPLGEKLMRDWTPEERATWDACSAWNTGYHETLAEIAEARPATLEGLTAQALAAAYHYRFDGDDDGLALALAHSVLALAGKPLPAWAEVAAREAGEMMRRSDADA
jgi:hypothetical protein